MLALAAHATASVHWLVERGADLNRADAPAFPLAARYGTPDLMRYLAAHGADIHARRKVGGDAYQQALYGKKLKHLPVIEALGHTVAMHGGEAFRSAVFNRNRQAVDFFLAHGVDINFGARDQVFSDSATPLLVAARNRDLNLCRLLVEHGADVSLSNRDGDRPYTVAVEQDDAALAAYFKSLEPRNCTAWPTGCMNSSPTSCRRTCSISCKARSDASNCRTAISVSWSSSR